MSAPQKITTLLFDIDDTLYDVGTGFTAHRNGEGVTSFMVAKLNYPDMETAKTVRDAYFAKYHSTAKALTVVEADGKLPPLPPSEAATWPEGKKRFDPQDLSKYWSEELDFGLLGGPYEDVKAMLESCPLKLVAFSNAPRIYALKVLKVLGLDGLFAPDHVFGVDDVLPACKPEVAAFQKVMDAVGVKDPSECVMVEDSMKNIRVAKSLGMGTVLVAGKGRMDRSKGKSKSISNDDGAQSLADKAEATKGDDAPDATDSAVDVSIETVAEMKSNWPALWNAE